jgi:hypothetical protein
MQENTLSVREVLNRALDKQKTVDNYCKDLEQQTGADDVTVHMNDDESVVRLKFDR